MRRNAHLAGSIGAVMDILLAVYRIQVESKQSALEGAFTAGKSWHSASIPNAEVKELPHVQPPIFLGSIILQTLLLLAPSSSPYDCEIEKGASS